MVRETAALAGRGRHFSSLLTAAVATAWHLTCWASRTGVGLSFRSSPRPRGAASSSVSYGIFLPAL